MNREFAIGGGSLDTLSDPISPPAVDTCPVKLVFPIFVQTCLSMDTMEMVGAIAIAFALGGTLAYIFWKEQKKSKKAETEKPRTDQQHSHSSIDTLQLQLQAYERLILLTERIALPNLISRMNEPGVMGKDMQMLLTQTIKQEFDHNITQQLYVSAEAWDAVRNLKEQNIHIINQIASFLPADVSGLDLNKQLLEMIVQNPKVTLHNVVAEVLSFEAKKLMS
jgi:hypothetical protein